RALQRWHDCQPRRDVARPARRWPDRAGKSEERSKPRRVPNGRWMAFESDPTGRYEIHVSPFPELKSGTQQITTTGGTMPVWSRDQKHLYYWTIDGNVVTIMSGPVVAGPPFTGGQPTP